MLPLSDDDVESACEQRLINRGIASDGVGSKDPRLFGRDGIGHDDGEAGENPIDGNHIPAGQKGAGYPCFGQPGRATDANGDGAFEPSPCYAWNNTLNGAKLNMILRRWNPKETELQGEHVQEGRDFFNEPPKPEDYRPFAYPHPLQRGLEAKAAF